MKWISYVERLSTRSIIHPELRQKFMPVFPKKLTHVKTIPSQYHMLTEFLMKGEYKKNCSHYWFLDTHFAVSFGVKIDDVVTAMVVPAVHQHCMQDVVGWVLGVRLLKELIQR